MMLVNVIECRSAVLFIDRKRGFPWRRSTMAVCQNGTVEALAHEDVALQAMRGDYDPDIQLVAYNDNFVQVGPIRECAHTAIIYAGA
jgi:hypothetical protein